MRPIYSHCQITLRLKRTLRFMLGTTMKCRSNFINKLTYPALRPESINEVDAECPRAYGQLMPLQCARNIYAVVYIEKRYTPAVSIVARNETVTRIGNKFPGNMFRILLSEYASGIIETFSY